MLTTNQATHKRTSPYPRKDVREPGSLRDTTPAPTMAPANVGTKRTSNWLLRSVWSIVCGVSLGGVIAIVTAWRDVLQQGEAPSTRTPQPIAPVHSHAACRQHIVGDRGVARPVVRSPLPGLRRVLPQRHAGRLDRQPGRRACSTSRSRAALTSSHRPCGSRGMPGSRTECHPSRITPRWLSRAGTDSGRGKPLRHMGL